MKIGIKNGPGIKKWAYNIPCPGSTFWAKRVQVPHKA